MLKQIFQILVCLPVFTVLPLWGRLSLLTDKVVIGGALVGIIFTLLAPYTSPKEIITPNQLDRNSTLGLLGSCSILFIVSLIHYAYVPRVLSQYYFALGCVIVTLGLLFRAWTTHTLGAYFTTNVTMTSDQKFITQGPYQWIRHPGYLATLIVTLGLWVLFQSSWGLLSYVIAVIPAYLYRIEVEERLLLSQFGEKYLEHKKKTRKLIPFFY